MRRLIVCSDGTWKTAEATHPTNVVVVARALLPVGRDGVTQIVFYDPGVGTGSLTDRLSGGALGRGLDDNIKDAYRWLVYNHAPGDRVFFFGFSRGAYTVRSTVGMIRKCGLLRREHADRLQEAYELYRRRDDDVDGRAAVGFRGRYSHQIDVEFVGVWDTVGALGIPLKGLRFLTLHKYQFHDVKLSRIVRRAYHAVAIDERRKAFAPALWQVQPSPAQIVEQVWFAGAHSNVGGGEDDRGLSDLTFRWMQRKAEAAGLGFDEFYVSANVRPDPRGPIADSKTGVYRVLGTLVRPIGTDPSQREAVSRSAVTRLLDGVGYDPPNLRSYLAQPGALIADTEAAAAIPLASEGTVWPEGTS